MREGHKPHEFAAFIGIDWGDQNHEVCLVNAGAEELERLELQHTPEALNEWLATLRRRFRGWYVVVAAEQTRGGLVHSLTRYEPIVLYPINPATSAQIRAARKPSRAEDDITDAELLREIVRLHPDRLRRGYPNDVQTR